MTEKKRHLDFRKAEKIVLEDPAVRAEFEKQYPEYEKRRKSFFEMNKEEQEALLAEATTEAIKRAHDAGRYTTHADEAGKLYRFYPDGRREYINREDSE